MLIMLLHSALALSPDSTGQWVSSRRSSEGLLNMMQAVDLNASEASQTERLIRKHVASEAKKLHSDLLTSSCSDMGKTLFRPPNQWSDSLSGSQIKFFDSVFEVTTGYCMNDTTIERVYEEFMSTSFRLEVMPRLTHYDLDNDNLCIQADGVRSVIKKAAFCMAFQRRQSKNAILVHTILKSNNESQDHQQLYYREAVLLFVQLGTKVGVRRLIVTRAQDLNAMSKMLIRKTATRSVPKIKATLKRYLNRP